VRSNFFAAMPAYQGSHRRPFLRPRNSHILVVSIYLRKWYRFGSGRKLAGRVAFIDMSGFDISELSGRDLTRLWYRGGFPRSFLALSEEESYSWRQDFIRTFLERDIPQLGITVPSETLRRFWTMLAHYHGQTWNGSEFARAIGATEPTARRYMDLLSGAYVIRQLQPWYENIGKRQVKSPKIYIRDSGLLHALLLLKDDQIRLHPKNGASWEGFIVEQVIALLETPVWYWATHAGSELDLFTVINGKRTGIEIKFADAPGLTKSMHLAFEDLKLDRLFIIYPGKRSYPLRENIKVIPAGELEVIIKSECNS
ncbi:MAG: DUF4143 domain-containing protein, partial [Bacteroidetes bacterium]|nr:DUF4143 domain-containing protein [Bacteroidota bacterium]